MADVDLIIKIPEEKYNKFMYSDDIDEEELVEAFEYLTNGTPIPNNATNDDVLKALFDERGYMGIHDRMKHTKWLSAPYQKGSKT